MTAALSSEAELYEKIVSFVLRETRTRKQITLQTDLAHNLGLDGDDASDFMRRFQDEFAVDMSNFKFDAYFGEEGFNLIKFVRSIFSSSTIRAPLTVGVLFEAAKRRGWPSEA